MPVTWHSLPLTVTVCKLASSSPRPSARVLSATPSRFGWLIEWMMWMDYTLCACTHFDFSGIELLASTMPLQLSWNKNVTLWMEWRRNLMSPRDNAVFRRSMYKDEQALPVRKWATHAKAARTRAFNLAMKRENVGRRNKQGSTEGMQSSTAVRGVPVDVSIKQPNKISQAAGSKRRYAHCHANAD